MRVSSSNPTPPPRPAFLRPILSRRGDKNNDRRAGCAVSSEAADKIRVLSGAGPMSDCALCDGLSSAMPMLNKVTRGASEDNTAENSSCGEEEEEGEEESGSATSSCRSAVDGGVAGSCLRIRSQEESLNHEYGGSAAGAAAAAASSSPAACCEAEEDDGSSSASTSSQRRRVGFAQVTINSHGE